MPTRCIVGYTKHSQFRDLLVLFLRPPQLLHFLPPTYFGVCEQAHPIFAFSSVITLRSTAFCSPNFLFFNSRLVHQSQCQSIKKFYIKGHIWLTNESNATTAPVT